MGAQDFSGKFIDHILVEINNDINLLYVIPCVYTRNLILNHLRDKLSIVESFTKAVQQTMLLQPQPLQQHTALESPAGQSAPLQPSAPGNQTIFTQRELSKYDGKNGSPAYVAVNGIVYDVTNNAAWAAASHFGLMAGKDLTNEFASCHSGQPILSKLKAVGKLV